MAFLKCVGNVNDFKKIRNYKIENNVLKGKFLIFLKRG